MLEQAVPVEPPLAPRMDTRERFLGFIPDLIARLEGAAEPLI